MRIFTILLVITIICSCNNTKDSITNTSGEAYRPKIHFTPRSGWMNDPNGLVFFNNTYHLFYQHYPDSTVWGPMHWGHATSKDLIQWQHEPIALYPDSLGYIFSGSAVVDTNNTSGFGKDGKTPLVAIFTHHKMEGEKAGRSDYQNQSLAYSLDEGKTWTKYEGNPVLRTPGIKDFRDPKVFWYEQGKKWVMSLATVDRISFYSSKDLRSWTKESEFGQDRGAHGGVWECPDLFPLEQDGKIWVLLVSINPGGPNGGSATQYFTGTFDGTSFVSDQKETRWLDYGPDNYAGVTFDNVPNRRIFIGWMSNWQYGNLVPTKSWRSAMTVPRELSLTQIGTEYYVSSKPVSELNMLNGSPVIIENTQIADKKLKEQLESLNGPAQLAIDLPVLDSFSIRLYNRQGQTLVIGFDPGKNEYFIDRTNAGKSDFEKGFAKRQIAPRISTTPGTKLILVIDDTSVELFADNGLSVMTAIFFPDQPYSGIRLSGADNLKIGMLQFNSLQSLTK